MHGDEKIIEQEIGLKYYSNFPISELRFREKAFEVSGAIGKIMNIAYDRKGNQTIEEKALYFKNNIEAAKFLHAYNHPDEYVDIDLSKVSDQQILAEVYKRMNRGLI